MRLCIVGAALLLTSTAAAQSRWTLSTGPEWTRWTPSVHLWGVRLRAEYDLVKPNSVFGLRLDGGALWGPTQNYVFASGSSIQGGVDQTADIMLGVSAAIAPFPRARLSPYVSAGVFGRQVWRTGSFFVQDSTVNTFDTGSSRGYVITTVGLGLRAQLSGRSFQLELRGIHDHFGLTFGTRLPF